MNEIEVILNNIDYTKLQIIDLGVYRFGISRLKLMRLSKNKVLKYVRVAINHENSLNIIARVSRRSGRNRTS